LNDESAAGAAQIPHIYPSIRPWDHERVKAGYAVIVLQIDVRHHASADGQTPDHLNINFFGGTDFCESKMDHLSPPQDKNIGIMKCRKMKCKSNFTEALGRVVS
jgi:hypothetical protein